MGDYNTLDSIKSKVGNKQKLQALIKLREKAEEKSADFFVWSTEEVEKYLENKRYGRKQTQKSPFFEDNIKKRRGGIENFAYTEYELEEIERCASDIEYFADKYAYSMTDEGVIKIDLFPYQRKALKFLQDERRVVWLASRQVGKTVMSSIFICWYVCFHFDRNVLVVANKEDTMKEILSKITTVYENLPFFLKPGVVVDNVKAFELDNDCRVVGAATSESPGLGFTIHLLYADEFAHVPKNIIDSFYKSIMPTLSSSEISKCIFTSTPKGMNKFWEIYEGAISGTSPFKALKTLWSEHPKHDDAWKDEQIALLNGSIEDWTQEFECSFLKTEDLFLDKHSIVMLDKLKRKYIERSIPQLYDIDIQHHELKWDPCFSFNDIKLSDRFLISIDTSDGVGRDYCSVIIFKIEPMSVPQIKRLSSFSSEIDFFRIRQIGVYHTNKKPIDELIPILDTLFFSFFNPEQIKIILEMNFKGDLIIEGLKKNKNFYYEMFVHTKHTEKAEVLLPGIKLNKKNKNIYVNEFRSKFKQRKIVINEFETIQESKVFGRTPKGTYAAQSGHDDLIMACINTVIFFTSGEFIEMVEDIYDNVDTKKIRLIDNKITLLDNEQNDMMYYDILKDF